MFSKIQIYQRVISLLGLSWLFVIMTLFVPSVQATLIECMIVQGTPFVEALVKPNKGIATNMNLSAAFLTSDKNAFVTITNPKLDALHTYLKDQSTPLSLTINGYSPLMTSSRIPPVGSTDPSSSLVNESLWEVASVDPATLPSNNCKFAEPKQAFQFSSKGEWRTDAGAIVGYQPTPIYFAKMQWTAGDGQQHQGWRILDVLGSITPVVLPKEWKAIVMSCVNPQVNELFNTVKVYSPVVVDGDSFKRYPNFDSYNADSTGWSCPPESGTTIKAVFPVTLPSSGQQFRFAKLSWTENGMPKTAWRTMADKTLSNSICRAGPLPVSSAPDFSEMSDLPIEWQALGATCWQREADPELPTDTLMPSYSLTVNKVDNGSVTGAGSYQAGSPVTLTATPDTGWTFAGWSPSPCNNSFQMPANALTCTATFEKIVISQCTAYDPFAHPQVSIPCLNAGGTVYKVGMNLISNTSTMRFEVSSVQPSSLIPTSQCAVFPDSKTLDHLRINCLDLGTDKYWVDLKLVKANPLQFDLVTFGLK
jgi:hypothetical protein